MRVFAIIVSIFVVAVIVLGFWQMGTPQSARQAKLDRALIDRLSQAEYQVREHIELVGDLPDVLDLGEEIRYERLDEKVFALCASFRNASDIVPYPRAAVPIRPPDKESLIIEPWNDWSHPAGEHCFERTVTLKVDE